MEQALLLASNRSSDNTKGSDSVSTNEKAGGQTATDGEDAAEPAKVLHDSIIPYLLGISSEWCARAAAVLAGVDTEGEPFLWNLEYAKLLLEVGDHLAVPYGGFAWVDHPSSVHEENSSDSKDQEHSVPYERKHSNFFHLLTKLRSAVAVTEHWQGRVSELLTMAEELQDSWFHREGAEIETKASETNQPLAVRRRRRIQTKKAGTAVPPCFAPPSMQAPESMMEYQPPPVLLHRLEMLKYEAEELMRDAADIPLGVLREEYEDFNITFQALTWLHRASALLKKKRSLDPDELSRFSSRMDVQQANMTDFEEGKALLVERCRVEFQDVSLGAWEEELLRLRIQESSEWKASMARLVNASREDKQDSKLAHHSKDKNSGTKTTFRALVDMLNRAATTWFATMDILSGLEVLDGLVPFVSSKHLQRSVDGSSTAVSPEMSNFISQLPAALAQLLPVFVKAKRFGKDTEPLRVSMPSSVLRFADFKQLLTVAEEESGFCSFQFATIDDLAVLLSQFRGSKPEMDSNNFEAVLDQKEFRRIIDNLFSHLLTLPLQCPLLDLVRGCQQLIEFGDVVESACATLSLESSPTSSGHSSQDHNITTKAVDLYRTAVSQYVSNQESEARRSQVIRLGKEVFVFPADFPEKQASFGDPAPLIIPTEDFGPEFSKKLSAVKSWLVAEQTWCGEVGANLQSLWGLAGGAQLKWEDEFPGSIKAAEHPSITKGQDESLGQALVRGTKQVVEEALASRVTSALMLVAASWAWQAELAVDVEQMMDSSSSPASAVRNILDHFKTIVLRVQSVVEKVDAQHVPSQVHKFLKVTGHQLETTVKSEIPATSAATLPDVFKGQIKPSLCLPYLRKVLVRVSELFSSYKAWWTEYSRFQSVLSEPTPLSYSKFIDLSLSDSEVGIPAGPPVSELRYLVNQGNKFETAFKELVDLRTTVGRSRAY